MTNVTSQRGSSMSISGHTQSSQDGSANAIGFVRATRSVRRRDRLPNPKPRLGHEGAPLGQCGRNQTIEINARRARRQNQASWIRRAISLAFRFPPPSSDGQSCLAALGLSASWISSSGVARPMVGVGANGSCRMLISIRMVGDLIGTGRRPFRRRPLCWRRRSRDGSKLCDWRRRSELTRRVVEVATAYTISGMKIA